VLQVAGGCRFLTDPLPTPEPSNRTAKINMPFAESTEPRGAGLTGGLEWAAADGAKEDPPLATGLSSGGAAM
jgi:hypothetical protein